MAFTKSPYLDTYSNEALEPVVSLDLRPVQDTISSRISPGMRNLHPITEHSPSGKTLICESRKQIVADFINGSTTVVMPLRGIYVWEKSAGTIYYFAVNGKQIMTSTTGLFGSWAIANTFLTTASSPVGFTEFIDSSTNTKKLVVVDGVEGYVFTSNAAGTKIVDADFPTPHVPYPVFIDGYLFLAKKNTGDIYNSDLNDPSSWTPGNFISSELYPDDIQALAKINNYLLAIGTQGCEYFYDAANAIGSPLAREDGSSLPFGTTLPYTIASNKNTVVMLANNNDGTAVLKVIQDKQHKDIPSHWLVPFMGEYLAMSGDVASSFRGYFMRHGSDLCYAIKCNSSGGGLGCFIYSFETDVWTEYDSAAATSGGFPVDCTAFSTSGALVTFVGGNNLGSPFFGCLGYTSFSSNITTEPFTHQGKDWLLGFGSAVNFVHELRPHIMDFGTLNRKTMSRMGVALSTIGPPAPTDLITGTIYWNDFDDGNFITGVTLTATGTTEFPFITQLGSFRQRRFLMRFDAPNGVKIRRLEFSINKGSR